MNNAEEGQLRDDLQFQDWWNHSGEVHMEQDVELDRFDGTVSINKYNSGRWDGANEEIPLFYWLA